MGPGFSRRWVVPAGTTLVLDGPDGARAATVLSTDADRGMRADRDAMLRRWADEGDAPSAASQGPRRWAPRSSPPVAVGRSACRGRRDSCT